MKSPLPPLAHKYTRHFSPLNERTNERTNGRASERANRHRIYRLALVFLSHPLLSLSAPVTGVLRRVERLMGALRSSIVSV